MADLNGADPSSVTVGYNTLGGAALTDTQTEGQGSVVSSDKKKKENIAIRFCQTTRQILCSSWLNVGLVFVPVGIAVQAVHVKPTVVFAMNAIAIVPLAGLLSYATESVAKRMGDTVGALMNVTFGNSVELIIFIIALTKNELRIVQASLLGSILANLLVILGMSFLLGGLRYREQIYNSTVTQMSACLLSVSVMSLLLPTAFHAAFNAKSKEKAKSAVLQVSRGTSIVLLFVYGLYLIFQLNSHAYMHQSTPQHLIDEESVPGPVAVWLESSLGSSSSSGSSSDDSDGPSGRAARIRRAIRIKRGRRRRRRESDNAVNFFERQISSRTPSNGSGINAPAIAGGASIARQFTLESIDADVEANFGEHRSSHHTSHHHPSHSRSCNCSSKDKHQKMSRIEWERQKKAEKKQKRAKKARENEGRENAAQDTVENENPTGDYVPRRVDFAVADVEMQGPGQSEKKPFYKSIRSCMPKTLSHNVFTLSPSALPRLGSSQPVVSGPTPPVRYSIRRANSLPTRLNTTAVAQAGEAPTLLTLTTSPSAVPPHTEAADEDEKNISRTTAVLLLLISTGLVAVCAEFLVGSIHEVTTNTVLGETFVGLIILPIVGNAAEHVTAVTVAMKNKMDLAIGVAVGSSIQMGACSLSVWVLEEAEQKLTVRSPLRDALHRAPRLDDGQAHDAVLHALRDGVSLRVGLHRQLPRAGRAQQLPQGRAAVLGVRDHRRRRVLLSGARRPESPGRECGGGDGEQQQQQQHVNHGHMT